MIFNYRVEQKLGLHYFSGGAGAYAPQVTHDPAQVPTVPYNTYSESPNIESYTRNLPTMLNASNTTTPTLPAGTTIVPPTPVVPPNLNPYMNPWQGRLLQSGNRNGNPYGHGTHPVRPQQQEGQNVPWNAR